MATLLGLYFVDEQELTVVHQNSLLTKVWIGWFPFDAIKE